MEETKTKNNFPVNSLFTLLLLFSVNLAFGLMVAFRISQFFKSEGAEIVLVPLSQFLLSFVLALTFILAVLWLARRFKERKRIFLKMFFLLAVASGAFIAWGIFLGDFAIIPLFLFGVLWFLKPNVILQNVLVISAIAGAGSLLGLKMNPGTVVLILVIFSIYDYIAVYKTKHMVKMAKEMIEEGAVMGLILPQKISDFKAPIKEVSPGGERFFVLGGGDVAFPLLLSVSLLPRSLFSAIVVAVFSLIGLAFSFWFFFRQKERKAIPALPPIAFFSIIGFLLTLLIR